MANYQSGPVDQYTAVNAGVIPNDVFGVAINWFVNRTPLISRLPKVPVGSPQFLITNDNYRPRSFALQAAYTSAGTALTVTDSSSFAVGDVLNNGSQYFLVTAIANATSITVTPNYANSTGANLAN